MSAERLYGICIGMRMAKENVVAADSDDADQSFRSHADQIGA